MDVRTRVAALSLALLCLPPALAQPAPTGPGSEAYAAFDAAAAREKQLFDARERALAAAKAKESAVATAERAEMALRTQQLATVQRTEREIVALLDRIEGGASKPRKLLTEQAVLQDWYDTLQPVVAHLTERSFRGAEVQLAALAASGAIEPGVRRFKSYLELRNRLAEVGRLLAANRAQAKQSATALRGQVQVLMARRDRELEQLARVDPRLATAVGQWQESTRALNTQGNELLESRKVLERTLGDVLDAAGSLRPPVLSEVTASVDGNTIYVANWRRPDGSSGSEREREKKRAGLTQARNGVETVIDGLEAHQRELHAARVESAERMHRWSGFLQRSADRYSAKLESRFWTELGLDVGLTVAEIVVTGGTATLARKSATLAQEALARTEAAAGRRAVAAASPLEAALVQRTAIPGEALSDSLRKAAKLGKSELEDEAEAVIGHMVRDGVAEAAARQQVYSVYRPLITRLQEMERNQALANKIQASILALENSDITWKEVLGNGWDASKDELAIKLGGDMAQANFEKIQQWRGMPDTGTATAVALGEGFKTALSVTAITYAADPSQAAAAAGRAAKLGSKAWNGLGSNFTNVGFAAVGSIIQVAAASKLDEGVNAEALNFAKLMGELDYAYAIYRAQLATATQLDATIVYLRSAVAGMDGAIKLLDSGLQLDSRPTPTRVSPDGSLRLELVFSSPLAMAPTVSLGGKPMSMQRMGTTGLRWQGSIPVRTLGRGTQALSVSASEASTRYGALDSDPTTPAIRLTSKTPWRGFEAGADTRHHIPLMAGDPPPPPPPASTAASDPFDEGRAMVDAGADAVRPGAISASELAGMWIGTNYNCDGTEPPERLRIVAAGAQELVATKTLGDNCIHAGEVSWRGKVSANTITGALHTRSSGAPANADAWVDGSFQIISRDEIRGFGMTFTRER